MQKSLKSFISYAWGSKELRIAMYILFTAIFFVVFELTPLMDWLRQSLVSFSVSITIVVAITVMSFFLNYLFHNEDLKVAMEKMEKVIETINMGWLLPESVVLEKESKADEIWVFQTNLEKEYDTQKGEVGEAVLNNLKSGKKYTYFSQLFNANVDFTFGKYKAKFPSLILLIYIYICTYNLIIFFIIESGSCKRIAFYPIL